MLPDPLGMLSSSAGSSVPEIQRWPAACFALSGQGSPCVAIPPLAVDEAEYNLVIGHEEATLMARLLPHDQ